MATDGFRRRIAAALAEPAGRDRLWRLLRECDAPPQAPSLLDDAADEALSNALLSTSPLADGNSFFGSGAFTAIIDSVRDPVVAVGADGRVIASNTAAARVFGAESGTLLGGAIGDFLPALGAGLAALEARAERVDDTFIDLAPELLDARRADGRPLRVEVTVSKTKHDDNACFVLCMRDVTERLRAEQALRDSEERYRALVENAPEAIVVLDVAQYRFVDANENAVKLFKMSRPALLDGGPRAISPACQTDGSASFALVRGYLERALAGGRPVFEWLHCDAEGREIPCEVRLIRLPASDRQLVRASIIDISARRRADMFAFGERRLLELIAANAPLERTLGAVVRLMEQMHPDVGVTLMLLDESALSLRLAASAGVTAATLALVSDLAVSVRSSACGAAASLGRQVVVRDIAADSADWSPLGAALLGEGLKACCSTPIATAGDRIHGTLALYFKSERSPTTEELDLVTRLTQLAGIAIRRKLDETELRDSEARFRALFDNVVDGVFQATADGRLVSVNPALTAMLGFGSAAELCGRTLADLAIEPRERERLAVELAMHGRAQGFEYRLRRQDGCEIVVVESSRAVAGAHGREPYIEGTITDITERKAVERALFREKERAQITLKSIGDAVVTTDADGNIEYLNPVAEELTGWECRHAVGRPLGDVLVLAEEASGERIEPPALRCLRENRTITMAENAVLTARDGTVVAIQDSAAPIQDATGVVIGAVMVFHDVSRERQLYRKLAYQASHDPLTGMINRRAFEERLSAALHGAAERGERHVVLCMDLDQFKVVNDTCGHAAGDLLLRQLADVLRSGVRATDVLARLGGDEFALLLADCATEQAVEIAEGLRDAIERFRFTWHDSAMQIGASIGVVPIDGARDSVASLMSAADVACYVAKDLGRNRIHVYEEGDAAERHQEMQWVSRIKRGLELERFELFYQPIVPIGRTRRDAQPHYELLLRMRDERGGIVPPDSFIPAAERYNLMPSLDRWVLVQVLETLAHREGDGREPYTLAVNLSGTTLNDARFLDFVLDQLEAHNVSPGALCFEITETAAIASLDVVVRFMRALQARGCQFSLDDFGTGLSSLTYLKNLPVDYVKIDGQFIRNVTKDAADESVVEAIARMAKAFDIETIAERVESHQVFKRLGELGVEYAQGFFIAVPQPISELPIRTARKPRT